MNQGQLNTIWGDSHTDLRQQSNIHPSVQQYMWSKASTKTTSEIIQTLSQVM